MDGTSYAYDGHRWRMEKTSGGATTVYIYSGSKVLAEYAAGAAPTAPSTEYVYSGGSLLATLTGNSITYHYPDHLSNRLETNSAGTVTRTFGHLPFGETWYETGAADKWKFTGYERDTSESGLDYAMNRMYSSGYGRFETPDLLSGTRNAPQSLNRYGYVFGNPVNLFDPSGMAPRIAEIATVDVRFYEFQFLDIFFREIDAAIRASTPPTGEGWVNPGEGDPELKAAGCLVNISHAGPFGDMEWCPGWDTFTFSWGGSLASSRSLTLTKMPSCSTIKRLCHLTTPLFPARYHRILNFIL